MIKMKLQAARSKFLRGFLSVAVGCVALTAVAQAQSPLTLTDVRGRTVTIEQPVGQISIDDGRFLVALALIHDDPVGLLAAWPADINRLGDDAYAAFLEKSPGLANVARVPSSAQAFDVESVLAASPDVAVVSSGTGPTDAQVALLQAAGIPVVFVDFFVNPLQNLEPSLRLLGQLTGSLDAAEEYIAFRAERVEQITSRVAQVPEDQRPTVFLEAHAGMTPNCCNSVGRGNIGVYIDLVGGHNIGADVLLQAAGQLSLEYVIERDPEIYIGTGGPHLAQAGGLVLGAAYTPEQSREALQRVSARTGIASLTAVTSGNAHGFSHQLINSPLDILAIEVFAKWIHPELFADLDPLATLAELNERFLTVPYAGTYWIDLVETGAAVQAHEGETPDGARYVIPAQWVAGQPLTISGTGWTTIPGNAGSTIAVVYDFGSVFPLDPVDELDELWARVVAAPDGSWSAQLPFPTAQNASQAWAAGETHRVHLLTGSLGMNDKVRNPSVEVTIVAAE